MDDEKNVPPNQADTNSEGPVQSPITQQAFDQRKPVFNPMGRVEDINKSEVKIADIRRHPFGLVLIYLQVIVAYILAFGLILFLLPSVVGENNSTADTFLAVLMLASSVLAALFLVIATKIYRGNQLILTDINVTQVLQTGLFSRKVSELTMENVEDVTADQNGIFPTIFNYGTLRVETAGEQNNFIFKYCPNPNAYAKALQDARASYYAKHTAKPPGNV